MITNAIRKAFLYAQQRDWTKSFWAIDVHETILVPTRSKVLPTEFYPDAKETLQLISERVDICPILYTSSRPEEIKHYLQFFAQVGIRFDYANENPEVPSMGYGYFEEKFYFNVLFDDKAGFDPFQDWKRVRGLLSDPDQDLRL